LAKLFSLDTVYNMSASPMLCQHVAHSGLRCCCHIIHSRACIVYESTNCRCVHVTELPHFHIMICFNTSTEEVMLLSAIVSLLVSRITRRKKAYRFSQNPVECWHMGHGRNQSVNQSVNQSINFICSIKYNKQHAQQ